MKDRQRMIKRLEDLLKKARETGKNRAFALLANKLIQARISTNPYKLGEDPHRLVQLAEEARSRMDSDATRQGLISALLYRAGKALEKQSPEYAALVDKCRYSLDDSLLLPYAMTRPGKLKELILQNHDVKRAIEVTLQRISDLPDSVSLWRWALVQASHPKVARALAQKLGPDSYRVLELAIERKLNPLSGSGALDLYWLALSQGEKQKAQDILEEYKKRGVPLP